MNRYYRSQVDLNKYKPGNTAKKSGGFFVWLKSIKKAKNAESKNSYSHLEKRPLSNPWRQKPKKNWRNIIALSFSVIFILSWAGLMFFLPYFQINKIYVTGQKITKAEDVERMVRDEILNHRKNYFLFPDHRAEEGIKEKFGLQSVKIIKKFPHEITIQIEEKITSVIVFDGYKYHLLDKNGAYITQILNDIKESDIINSENTSSTEISSSSPASFEINSSTLNTSTPLLEPEQKPDIGWVRKNSFDQPIVFIKDFSVERANGIIDTKDIEKIIEWQNIFNTKDNEEIKYFAKIKDESGVRVYVNRSWYILFNSEKNLPEQVVNLESILSSCTPNEYIDLRFGEKIYWK